MSSTQRNQSHQPAAFTFIAGTMLSVSLLATDAYAQDQGLLAGPEVIETTSPESGTPMDGMQATEGPRSGELPLRAYLGAIRKLHPQGEADASIKLTQEQGEQIRAIAQTHGDSMKAFMESRRDELEITRALSGREAPERREGFGEKQGKERRDADRADRVDGQDGERRREARPERADQRPERGAELPAAPANPEVRERARAKFQEIMSEAPSDQEAKAQIWSILTQEQRAFVTAELDQMRAKRAERVEQRRLREADGQAGQVQGADRERGRKDKSKRKLDNAED